MRKIVLVSLLLILCLAAVGAKTCTSDKKISNTASNTHHNYEQIDKSNTDTNTIESTNNEGKIAISSDTTAKVKVWHVDDDKKDFPNAEYASIQDAINNAKDGDVIVVYRGAYSPFVINKRVNVTGIDFPEVLASNKSTKIEIAADGATLKGILTNATLMLNSSNNIIIGNGFIGKITGIVINGKNNTIADNALIGNKYGVLLHSDNNTLFLNSFRGCDFSVSGRNVSYTLITENEFLGNNVSMVLFYSKNNVISKNLINSRVLGVHLFGCSKTLVSENKFINSTGWALRIYGGGSNIIGGNAFENNTVTEVNGVPAGFNIFLMNTSSDLIVGNVIGGIIQNIVGIFAFNASDLTVKKVGIENNVYGLYLWKCNNVRVKEGYIAFNNNGTRVDDSSNVVIYNSTFQNNDWATIAKSSDLNISRNLYILNLNTINLKSSKAEITKNLIVKNKHGVVLDNSNSCLIENNVIANIDDYAVSLLNSDNNLIYNNTMKDNRYGLKITGTKNEITRNTVGIKDGLRNYVLYLTKPGNKIYFNDFLSDTVFTSGGNRFYSPTKLKYRYNGKTFTNYLGNFWNDITESMLKMLDPDNDGILIKQKLIGIDKDSYPLAKSIKNYEILN